MLVLTEASEMILIKTYMQILKIEKKILFIKNKTVKL